MRHPAGVGRYGETAKTSNRRVVLTVPAVNRFRAASAVLLAVVAVLALAGPARAHDQLTDSSPADGQTLHEPPEELVLNFSGELSDLGTQLVAAGPGGPVADGEPMVEGTRLTQRLRTGATAGDYTVTWRVVSSDGHPIAGEFSFTVDQAASSETDPADDAAQTTGAGAPVPEPADGTSVTEPVESSEADDTAAADVSEAQSETASGVPGWVWVILGLVAAAVAGVFVVRSRR